MRVLAALTGGAVRRCAASGVRLILLSAADPSDRLPLGRVIRRRATALTAMVGDLADQHRRSPAVAGDIGPPGRQREASHPGFTCAWMRPASSPRLAA